MTTTLTTTDLTHLLVIVLGHLERTTAAARVLATQKAQALEVARTLQAERDAAEAALKALVTAVENAGSHFESNVPDAMQRARAIVRQEYPMMQPNDYQQQARTDVRAE